MELFVHSGGRHVLVADKAKESFKQRIREMTRRSGGRSLPEIAERLRRCYVL